MSLITRPLALATVGLALSAGPALAAAPGSSSGSARAKTPLTAKIASETPLMHLFYDLEGRTTLTGTNFAANAGTALYAAREVSRIHADAAQYPGKLEWLLGAEEQARGANLASYSNKQSYVHHRRARAGADVAALAHLRLANYYLAAADSALGVRHPEYATAPYPGKKTNPITSPTPLLPRAPARTLTGEIAFATPVLTETILQHVPSTEFDLNEAADDYYLTLVGRMPVDGAQRPAQQQWLQGVRDLRTGDEQIIHGSERISGEPIPTSVTREIAAGFSTLRHANALIAGADARLGVGHPSVTATLPGKVLYTS